MGENGIRELEFAHHSLKTPVNDLKYEKISPPETTLNTHIVTKYSNSNTPTKSRTAEIQYSASKKTVVENEKVTIVGDLTPVKFSSCKKSRKSRKSKNEDYQRTPVDKKLTED
jgi:hypothetical protein